jgi:hypothetical protein
MAVVGGSVELGRAESALLKLYTEVWLPRAEAGEIGIETVAVGGRPLQTTLNAKKEAMIHERVMELLTAVQPRLFATLTPAKIIELFKLGEDQPPRLGVRTAEIVDGFYSFLGFPRLTTSGVIRKAITKGIQDAAFGYFAGGVPEIGADEKYQVPLVRVRFGAVVPDDEVDLESGFLMMPEALPVPVPVSGPPVTSPGGATSPVTGVSEPTLVPTPPGSPQQMQTAVEVAFAADRNQLFTAWHALANLADLAGKVSVTVRAESAKGFDRTRLQNGVLEPLKEADLIE